MAWSSKRMQYQGIESQLSAEAGRGTTSKLYFSDNSTRSGNWPTTNTRVRTGVKMQEPSGTFPDHDGGGDVQRPPTSYTARALRARKAAQMEYKAQLDLQMAERKKMKELEKSQNNIGPTSRVSTGPICGSTPAQQFQPAPSPDVPLHKNGVPMWLMASSPPPATTAYLQNESGAPSYVVLMPVSSGGPGPEVMQTAPNITFSPFPLTPSKSVPACHQTTPPPPPPNESVFDAQMPDSTSEVMPSSSSTPVAASQTSPQLLKSLHHVRSFVYPEPGSPCDQPIMNEPGSGTEPQFSSTPVSLNHRDNMESCSQVGGSQDGDTSYDGSFGQSSPSQWKMDEWTESPLASTYVQSPQPGTSPCGSYIGDSCSMTGSGSFLGSSSKSYKPHVSQTADQRPEESVIRTNYKAELKLQIEERKRLEEERKKLELEEEDKFQNKLKQERERMQKEYEEEQIKTKQKEEGKRQIQEENLKRLKEIEAESQREVQERRDRRKSCSISTEEVSQSFVEVKRPPSPPIPTLCKLNNAQETVPEFLPSEIEEKRIQVAVIPEPTPRTTTSEVLDEEQEEHPPGESSLTETLKFLKHLREILDQERVSSQQRYEKEIEELNELCFQ